MESQATRRSRTKPAAIRREELMNAAEALFLEKGVAATAIEEITTDAGVAKGTFYLHFSSKDEVHLALADRFSAQYVESLDAAVARRGRSDWQGKLAAWTKAAVVGFVDNGPLVNMLFHSLPQPPENEPNIIVANLQALLRAGTEAGAWTVEDPAFTAEFLFGGLHSVIDGVLVGGELVGTGKVIKRLQLFFCRTVGAPGC